MGAAEMAQERRLTLACVVDLKQSEGLETRQKAFDDIQKAAKDYKINLQHIEFDKLDYGEASVLDVMYSAEVAIVDMSLSSQQIALSGHLGSRERFGMQGSFIIYDSAVVHGLFKSNLGTAALNSIGYSLSNDGERCVVTDSWMSDAGLSLYSKLKQLLKDVQVTTSTHAKEKFLDDLRKAREGLVDGELKDALGKLRHRLDGDPMLLSPETVFNLLISYRDIQDYGSMISVIDDIDARKDQPAAQQCLQSDFMYLYAFALNRRNLPGDRSKARDVIEKVCSDSTYAVPDGLCLCGRIYKDMFMESNYTNREYLGKAIEWYRKGFSVKPNEFAGINLATLLVVSGERVEQSTELQNTLIQLNHIIGKKGSLELLQDYWAVATFFEMSVLAGNFKKAQQAAQCMYKLKPPLWHIGSTMGNIKLIDRSRKASLKNGNGSDSRSDSFTLEHDEELYQFWIELFEDASSPAVDAVHFPVLILEDGAPNKSLLPFFATVNADEQAAGERSIKLWQAAAAESEGIEWLFKQEHIKSAAPNKQDDRCLFLYVAYNVSEGLQLYFSCSAQRNRFYQLCKEFLHSAEDFVDLDDEGPALEYDYIFDHNGQRTILGSGTFGRVYRAKNSNTQVHMAVKEIKVANEESVQPLHDEIKLHSKLHHKNIVRYHGSTYENGFFKIFMEEVPGGSLSDLLRQWGPLKGNEFTIAFYSRHILEGLRYLHDQKIVHRDIKGGNVLINTYNGMLKISDFGTCKRLSGLNSNASSFKGTFQYMAPEVIDGQSQRGYATPADIWSFGCTVVEMAEGRPPHSDLQSPMAAMFKVGREKKPPTIPGELSEVCRDFVMATFNAEPLERMSATELLKHPFITEAQKRHKRASISMGNPLGEEKLMRSQSVPPDNSSVDSQNLPFKLRTVHNASMMAHKGVGTSNSANSTATVPGTPLLEDHDDPRSFWKLGQAEAQSALLEILKTERQTLVTRMMETFDNNNRDGISLIDQSTSDYLLQCVEKCIEHEDNGRIASRMIIDELKDSVELGDHIRLLKQLQLFLFLLKREVQDVLRTRSIKPHWMFAFDDFVSKAVQTILQEMGMSLNPNEPEPEHRAYTSQTSTSAGSSIPLPGFDGGLLPVRLGRVQDATAEVMEQLILAEERYQALLKRMLAEKNQQIRLLEAQLGDGDGQTKSAPY